MSRDILDKDLSAYINGKNLAPYPFEYQPKQKSVNLRISEELLNAVRVARAGAAFRINATSARLWRPR